MKFCLLTVEELTKEAVAQFNASDFPEHVQHGPGEEQKFKELSIS